jgi:hypothetical protein
VVPSIHWFGLVLAKFVVHVGGDGEGGEGWCTRARLLKYCPAKLTDVTITSAVVVSPLACLPVSAHVLVEVLVAVVSVGTLVQALLRLNLVRAPRRAEAARSPYVLT